MFSIFKATEIFPTFRLHNRLYWINNEFRKERTPYVPPNQDGFQRVSYNKSKPPRYDGRLEFF